MTAYFQSAQKCLYFNRAISVPVHKAPVVGQFNPVVGNNAKQMQSPFIPTGQHSEDSSKSTGNACQL